MLCLIKIFFIAMSLRQIPPKTNELQSNMHTHTSVCLDSKILYISGFQTHLLNSVPCFHSVEAKSIWVWCKQFPASLLLPRAFGAHLSYLIPHHSVPHSPPHSPPPPLVVPSRRSLPPLCPGRIHHQRTLHSLRYTTLVTIARAFPDCRHAARSAEEGKPWPLCRRALPADRR